MIHIVGRVRSDMEGHNRYLQFDNIEVGQTIASRCSVCQQTFVGIPRPNERTDDTLLRIRAAFNSHDCDRTKTESQTSMQY